MCAAEPESAAHAFAPVAMTALGVLDVRSVAFLRRLASFAAARKGELVGVTTNRLFMSMSIALWRAQAKMINAFRDLPRAARCSGMGSG